MNRPLLLSGLWSRGQGKSLVHVSCEADRGLTVEARRINFGEPG